MTPLFSFRGMYGNMRLSSLDTSNPPHEFTNRAPLIAQQIASYNATVGVFCEATATGSWATLDSYMPGWSQSSVISRMIMWKTSHWTFVEAVNLPMSGSKDIHMVKLYYRGNVNHWCWFICTHLGTGTTGSAVDERIAQVNEEIAAVASLGTDRWIFYSDWNEFPGQVPAPQADVINRHTQAGWLHQFQEQGLQLGNRDYKSINGYTAPLRPSTTCIDYVCKSGNGVHAIKHSAGQMVLNFGPSTYPSDHNWWCLTSQVYR